jgi:asparagine synthetase A
MIWPVCRPTVSSGSDTLHFSAQACAVQGNRTGARAELPFHRARLTGKLPQTMGGGIGQSRLCMYYLRTAHIGEVAVGIWPREMEESCARGNIFLL